MSKSLGNFFTIRDVLARYHASALRWFLVGAQYRAPVNFTQRALEEVCLLLSSSWLVLEVCVRIGCAVGVVSTVRPEAYLSLQRSDPNITSHIKT